MIREQQYCTEPGCDGKVDLDLIVIKDEKGEYEKLVDICEECGEIDGPTTDVSPSEREPDALHIAKQQAEYKLEKEKK